MSGTTTSDAAGSAPSGGPASTGSAAVQDSLAVLGMVAYLELAAFSRLAADAGLAPTLAQRLELSELARESLSHLDRVRERIVELGGDLEPVMAPHAGVLVEFDTRTVPSTWWERLLKAYVGYGVADDFCRALARTVDERTRAVVEEVLEGEVHTDLVVRSLARAAEADPTLASRLALWGRRLVGEALNSVSAVLAAHPEMRPLLEAAMTDERGPDAQQRLFALLTAEHSRRMGRLGLAA
ncbi:ferritin-like fold-containing protein [Actinotalea sp. Marseille-Q4924]|uniref:ferritin-like fold-containing protein n=1 Tax=Actinotalea sp. Marseille-Q4924 TaxID=2866571 RepID=UPI001CE3C465|nr:ferritin-like fold-containing protein [Actinotalea sp. Marseille-Q4924]